MKKISLKTLNLKEVELFSRKQLKDILGGYTGGTGPTESETETTEEPGEGKKCNSDCTGTCETSSAPGHCRKTSAGECRCASAS